MVNGFSKWIGILIFLVISGVQAVSAQNKVQASTLTYDVKDLSQRSSKIYDQNGERCALIKFETPIPSYFTFNLGAQQIEKRENKEDEVWIWVSADVKKMTIQCSNCSPLKDFRVSLKPGNVYRAKLTTGLPQETASTQKVNLYCERTPFGVSIDGAAPVMCESKMFYTELPVGVHSVMVTSRYYKPYASTIRVYRSRPYMDTIRLENNYGELQITCNQPGYKVFADGELQKNNRTVMLEPGEHKISITRERYQPFETVVYMHVGEKIPIKATMQAAFSVFNVTAADDDTQIWVDGKYRGIGRANIELVWGTHTIEGRRQGYDTWEYPIKDFNAQSEAKIKIPKLNQQFGGVRLSVYPPAAMVYVDGQQVSSQNGVYTNPHMTVGTHYVQFRLTDYKSIRDSIVVTPHKLYVHDYEMEALALGVATISTDREIGIYRIAPETDERIFLGHSTYTGKLPAGENIIELKNNAGVTCQYSMFINNKEEHQATFPYMRKLMVRKNIVGGSVLLRNKQIKVQEIKSDKKLSLLPMKYEIQINKRGYQPYKDSIDLSEAGVTTLIYRANLRKLNDTIDHPERRSAPFLQRFYDNAGTWYLGIIDFGYTFDLNGGLEPANFRHIVSAGILPFRYRMFGMSLVDLEMCVNDTAVMRTLSYKPKMSLYIPAGKAFAFTLYGGALVNLHDAFINPAKPPVRVFVIGGASMRFNYVGKFPMDLFAEYKWPVHGITPAEVGDHSQLFRVGVQFSIGVNH